MTADPVTSRELDALHNELSSAEQSRAKSPVSATASAPTKPSADAADDQYLHKAFDGFAEAIGEFVQATGKDASAQPHKSFAGGVVVGMLIGRFLARR